MSKSTITRAEFREGAQPVKVVIDGYEMLAEVKEFNTGSLGWNLNNKMTIDVGGTPVRVQIGLNLTIIGSKDLPKDEPTTHPTDFNDAYVEAFELGKKTS